jgi:hypothetical protein
MAQSNPSSKIGSRYIETQDRLKRLETYEDRLGDTGREFVIDMLDKLARYKEQTYVSAKQLNYINRLEEKCDDELF